MGGAAEQKRWSLWMTILGRRRRVMAIGGVSDVMGVFVGEGEGGGGGGLHLL